MRRSDGRRAGVVATLLRYELKMLLRDKRTVFFSIVLPVLMVPGILLLSRELEESREEELATTTYEYALTGSRAGWAGELVDRALALELPSDSAAAPPDFERRRVSRKVADSIFRAEEIHLLVEGMSAAEWRAARDSAREDDGALPPAADEAGEDEYEGGAAPDAAGEASVDVPALRIHYRSDSEVSRTARRRLRERLDRLRTRSRDSLLRLRGFPVDPADVAPVDAENVATAAKEGGRSLGYILTPFLVFLMLSGGSVVAADALSGEKERGTLETLLTTSASRGEIVAAKELAIVATGVAIAVINVANLLVYLWAGMIDLPPDFAVAVSPAGAVAILALLLPVTALVAAVLLLVSGYASSYKEYQIYFFPVMLLFVVPSFAVVLPGIELRSAVVAVPLANVSVAVMEVLTGTLDWPFLALAFGVTTAAAAGTARLTERTLSTERLISSAAADRAEIEGGPALFPRRVLRWFAVLWAIFLVSSLWIGTGWGIREQVAFNLVGLFLGGSALMLWRYRLDVREALALRAPPAAAWPAVLVGAPSAFFAAVGVGELSQLIFPVPDRMIEAFGQFFLPEELGLGQILFFLAVLPGFCEEIAFRGVLLHGLRRRFRPVTLTLVVGAIFGFFHVELFRLIPTAYIGVLLTAVVLLTGSIFPAMLWHALNNAVALGGTRAGWWSETPPMWTAWAGLVGLAVSFWILWRNRRPYPGLREGEGGSG